jgi:hypothetical protein
VIEREVTIAIEDDDTYVFKHEDNAGAIRRRVKERQTRQIHGDTRESPKLSNESKPSTLVTARKYEKVMGRTSTNIATSDKPMSTNSTHKIE